MKSRNFQVSKVGILVGKLVDCFPGVCSAAHLQTRCKTQVDETASMYYQAGSLR